MKKLLSLSKTIVFSFCIIISSVVTSFGQANDNLMLSSNISTTNQNSPGSQSSMPPSIIPPPPNIDSKGYVLLDVNSGAVLAQSNMNQRMAPASLTKLMTLYLIFQELQNNRIKMTDSVRISENAWRTGGSRMFVRVGTRVSVQDLINGIIIASGNDACVAMAEYIAGSQDSFSALMNKTAERLGMKNSHFMDATGLPDPSHYSSPYDLALLSQALVQDFPKYYPLFKQKWIFWNNIKQPNRDRLLWRDPSVDGLKTGHTEDAGYCLVTSALRNGMRLVSVVMGEPSDNARANDTQALLNWGFRFYESRRLFEANKVISKPRVWLGKKNYVPMGVAADFYATVPTASRGKLKATMKLDPNLSAPIVKGQRYGTIEVTLDDKVVGHAPVVALEDNPDGGIWAHVSDQVILFVRKWFVKSA